MSACGELSELPENSLHIADFRHTGGTTDNVHTAGQVVFLKLTNNTVHLTVGSLFFYQRIHDGEGGISRQLDCSVTFSVLPLSSAIYRSAGVLTDGRVEYVVQLRTEADVVDLMVNVHSSN